MRSLLACLLILGCDAGVSPTKPTPGPAQTPTPAPAPEPSQPAPPRVIDLQLGGLGVWKGNTVGGVLWHVRVDLTAAHLEITDPGGKTSDHALALDAVHEYTRLAEAARDEKHSPPRSSCTDRSEVLMIDTVVISDGCPLADPGASALSARLQRELK